MTLHAQKQVQTIKTIENAVESGFTLSETVQMLLKPQTFIQFAKEVGQSRLIG